MCLAHTRSGSTESDAQIRPRSGLHAMVNTLSWLTRSALRTCRWYPHHQVGYMCFASTSTGEGSEKRWEFMEWAKSGDFDKLREGEDRLTSYFDVFNADPKDFDIDLKQLEKRYKTLQKYLHPDKLSTGSQERRTLGEMYSAHVNEAYSVLRRPLSRANYMLQQRGLCIDEHTAMEDLDFLQEVMEIRERLDDSLSEEEFTALEKDIDGKIKELVAEIGALLKSEELLQAKELTAKLKYYDNIMNEIVRQK